MIVGTMALGFDVAAYIWPAYTGDELRSRIFWPDGYGEWQTVRAAEAKFPGHQWPRRPRWGYVNEADPRVMEMQIDAAADHGVNVFIYDWYWYDGRPFLENCLNDGFLRARNNTRMKFYLMWANHDVNHVWDKRLSHLDGLIWRAGVDRQEFEVIADRLITRYFNHPCYYRIGGKPVLQIYDLANLIGGLGGVEATRDAFGWFGARAREAGLPGVHLQMTLWGERNFNLSGVDGGEKISGPAVARLLGFESLSHYQFCHFVNIDRDYDAIIPDVEREWQRIVREYGITYFPHISVGWDPNPRFKELRQGIVKNNTPEAIERGLRKARAFAESQRTEPALITINSWNEWTETSYLQPDDLYGYGYLEAVRRVFGRE